MGSIGKAISGSLTSREALQEAAKKEQAIIDTYYPCGPTACSKSRVGRYLCLEVNVNCLRAMGWLINCSSICYCMSCCKRCFIYMVKPYKKSNFCFVEFTYNFIQLVSALQESADKGWKIDPTELNIIKQIGSGSFGNVYQYFFVMIEITKCSSEWRATDVAVKKILISSVRDKLKDFEREVEILRSSCDVFLL